MVLGGETTRENRENEHSTSIEILGPNGDLNISLDLIPYLSNTGLEAPY